jgi:hypothetical protein
MSAGCWSGLRARRANPAVDARDGADGLGPDGSAAAGKAAEEVARETNSRFEGSQGLKPNVYLIGFSGPAKAVPLLQSIPKATLFAASKARIERAPFAARLKPCTVTKRLAFKKSLRLLPAWVGVIGLGGALLLTGCSLFPTTRRLPVPKAPTVEQSLSAADLVAQLNERWAAINTLTAKVEIRASVSKTTQGVATDYPSVEGHILMRKPNSLRVVGQLIGVRIFDMASVGDCFTLSIPHDSKVIKGCGAAKVRSKNTWENLRPDFFFDAMLVRGLDPDDLYSRTTDQETVDDPQRKHLFMVPEYVLSISRRKPGTQQLFPVRVITLKRDTLLPYQQDLYDADGNLETQVTYGAYQDFGGSDQFPSTVTIKRPQEEITIVLTVESVKENLPLADDQFVVPIPEGSKIVNQQ